MKLIQKYKDKKKLKKKKKNKSFKKLINKRNQDIK